MNPKLQSLYGLEFHPFRPDVPVEALYTSPTVDAFLSRVELSIADGGYVLVTDDPGTGKSVALRLLARRLESVRDVAVGTIEHPQSSTPGLSHISSGRGSRAGGGRRVEVESRTGASGEGCSGLRMTRPCAQLALDLEHFQCWAPSPHERFSETPHDRPTPPILGRLFTGVRTWR